MKAQSLPLSGLILFTPEIFSDTRGYFMECFRASGFEKALMDSGQAAVTLVQENHSCSGAGVLRGLHFQCQYPQGKLIRVISGEIYDVAVDIRPKSPTFGQWHGLFLSAQNRCQLWIPPGFAHGFYVTKGPAEVIYKCSDYYQPGDEGAIVWNDADLAIDWPLNTALGEPLLSAKDRQARPFCAQKWV
ncbi:dTDP-4-dehydrorhamnose 3,5-epimerase [Shewanella algae]|uniref:dTDP-4-dehydrorhamnose 3,5-epimerase n=1 Tax=Shewanella algae TaxID=38313 RepID=UPI001AAC71E0|nr:dTDP-4-dehydrorhamnose 3,5-epimerase [Shewanella algae]MBO2678699.1 dTDP-4-dehydrorhamnose 3,5-epimerase [Shewanella algae]QTE80929.1 dTDP-4-dehydrorhamnose 3,5-epimerase [Shewanella algae]